MLELKDLTKTYKPKKGVPIKALNGVSLSFEEKGLVFILGRSGSGKSTLLNIVGGLDSADSGEIIIDGRSSKDFKTSDYDAYRNEYIGFIFQEYNLLDEFTVGENIMLALQLQNQKADKQRLESILKEVDLEGYADRKPNELSGGQRQRVTIARALVKSPKIIMADEPTGALDEETGRQVLETLKKMSKNKLVIVVSHDREFAEEYADRIIRLKDGKVSSDTANKDDSIVVKKNTVTADKKEREKKSRSHLPYRYALKMGASGLMTKPLRLIITIILCMVSFAAFGAVDTFNAFNAGKLSLNEYLKSDCEASAYTAQLKSPYSGRLGETSGASEKDLERLKQETGLDYVGVTITDRQHYWGYDLSLLSNEKVDGKNKSVYYTKRLYGFYPASTDFFQAMGFDLIGNLPQEENEIIITKYIFDQINLGGMDMYVEGKEFSDNDFISITLLPDPSRTAQSLIKQELFIKLRQEYWKIVGVIDTHADSIGKYASLKPSQEYNDNEQGLFEAECQAYFRYGYHSIGYISHGSYDTIVKSYSQDWDGWDEFGRPSKGYLSITWGSEEISNSFLGIAEDKDLNKVKDVIWLDGKERMSLNDNEIVIGLNTAIKLLQDKDSIERELYYTHDKTYFDGIISFDRISFYELYKGYENVAKYIVFFEEAEKASDSEINAFKNYISQKVVEHGKVPINELYHKIENFGYYTNNYVNVKEEFIEKDFDKLEEKHWRMMYASYLMSIGWRFTYPLNGNINNMVSFEMDGGYYDNAMGGRNGKVIEDIDAKVFYLTQKLQILQKDKFTSHSVEYTCDDFEDYRGYIKNPEIVGIYVQQDDFPEHNEQDTFVFNNTMYREMEIVEIEPYCFLLAPMPTDRTQLKKLVDVHYEDGDRVLQMHNGVVNAVNTVQLPINRIRPIFLLLGLGLAVFSIMMLGNYIGTSIADKKRDIGTLRALGAKASDVFAIFVTESIIIALFNSVLSIIVSVFLCGALNNMIRNQTQVSFSALNFGLRQVAIMIIINVVIAVIASLMPIYKMSKKKPIDCIRDR